MQNYSKGQTRTFSSYDTRMYDFCLISTVFVRKKLEDQDHAWPEIKLYITIHYITSEVVFGRTRIFLTLVTYWEFQAIKHSMLKK